MPRINFIVRVAVCFLFIFLPLQTLDQWFYDHFFRLRGSIKRPTNIVLVRVNDNRVLQAFAQKAHPFPSDDLSFEPRAHTLWFQRFYEPLVKAIQAQQPRLIAFTTYYEWIDERRRPRLPGPAPLFAAVLNEENKLIPPLALLTEDGGNYGFSNLFPDTDNIVRRNHLVYSSGASLALRTYHRLNSEPIKRNLLDPLWIDYRGPSGSYPSYDAWEIFEAGQAPAALKDSIVLIGKESTSAQDHETPFGRMPRLEIQANITDTFLSHRDIRIAPRFVTLITAAIAVVLSILIILVFPLTLAWLFLLIFSLLILLISLFAFSTFKVWAGVANPVLCIFVTHLLMLGFKLSRQEEQQWRLQQESEYLKELDQFKNNFISLFSHDLKTPIAKIKAITDRLMTENPALPEPLKEGLRGIDRTSGELARLISDILKVTKMESMSLEPMKEVIDLNRLVEIAVQRLKFMADEKEIKIVLDLEPLFSMEGDQQLIQEVITNLVENAIKYSGAQREVVIRTREEEGRVRVTVADQGHGIPTDELPRVTGKFYRGRSVTNTTKGSGLGLYLSKYFVELHQGGLDIKSQEGKGTEVSFWLPFAS